MSSATFGKLFVQLLAGSRGIAIPGTPLQPAPPFGLGNYKRATGGGEGVMFWELGRVERLGIAQTKKTGRQIPRLFYNFLFEAILSFPGRAEAVDELSDILASHVLASQPDGQSHTKRH